MQNPHAWFYLPLLCQSLFAPPGQAGGVMDAAVMLTASHWCEPGSRPTSHPPPASRALEALSYLIGRGGCGCGCDKYAQIILLQGKSINY